MQGERGRKKRLARPVRRGRSPVREAGSQEYAVVLSQLHHRLPETNALRNSTVSPLLVPKEKLTPRERWTLAQGHVAGRSSVNVRTSAPNYDLIIRPNHSLLLTSSVQPELRYQGILGKSNKSIRLGVRMGGGLFFAGNRLLTAEIVVPKGLAVGQVSVPMRLPGPDSA